MDPDAVAVVAAGAPCSPQADRHHPRSPQVHDALAALADDLARAHVAERLEQLAVEVKAPLEIGDDEIEVVDACSAHQRHAT
jgi:hypothetical protein